MSSYPRTRDCVILMRGSSYAVAVDPSLAASGWKGGQGMQWVASPRDVLTVTRSDGYLAGFALWGSDEPADQFISMTRQFPTYQFLVLGNSGWMISTSTFERYTYASRTGGGPLVPIVYNASDRLLFSLRGYWTNEDEWALSGDPRAPNTFHVGFVAQVPSPETNDYMTIQVSI
jgi:hypothetical protein